MTSELTAEPWPRRAWPDHGRPSGHAGWPALIPVAMRMRRAFSRAYVIYTTPAGNASLILRSADAHLGSVQSVNAILLTGRHGIRGAAGIGICGQPDSIFFTPCRGPGRFPRGSPPAGHPRPPRRP